MSKPVSLACERQTINVPLEKILPLRKLAKDIEKTEKFLRIAASIKEVGIIEPLVVFPQN